ncbi:MAG: extracellular solute-binding protein [Cohnella sp.]|nr:extracellular solute-binding protein [Cohnella sp.]
MTARARNHSIRAWCGLLSIALLIASGCSSGKKMKEAPESLKIACCDQRTFDSQYRDFLRNVYPNTRFDIVPLYDSVFYQDGSDQALKKTLEEASPDLVILNSLLYRSAADQGLLSDLEQVALARRFDLTPLSASMLDIARDNQSGKLFGLSPTFRASAIFYNLSMFQRYGVPVPDREMSWDEILRLAGRFASHNDNVDGTAGLQLTGIREPFDWISLIAQTEGLRFYDDSSGRLLFDSDGWKKVVADIVAAYRNGTFPLSGDNDLQDGFVTREDMLRGDLFGQGKAAMTIAGNEVLSRYRQQEPSFEWGLVPGPVQAGNPGKGGFVQVDALLGIPNKSAHADEAWEIIAYLMSEKTAKVYASLDDGLSVYRQAVDWRQDPDYGTFYKLKPAITSVNPLSHSIRARIADLVNEEITKAANDEATVEETIAAIQSKGEELLFLKHE